MRRRFGRRTVGGGGVSCLFVVLGVSPFHCHVFHVMAETYGAYQALEQAIPSPVMWICGCMLSLTLQGAYDNVSDDLLLIFCCCFCHSLCEVSSQTQQPFHPTAGG